jgi:uncharacterized protein (DUF3084 family)
LLKSRHQIQESWDVLHTGGAALQAKEREALKAREEALQAREAKEREALKAREEALQAREEALKARESRLNSVIQAINTV